jgi:hypothetical protein
LLPTVTAAKSIIPPAFRLAARQALPALVASGRHWLPVREALGRISDGHVLVGCLRDGSPGNDNEQFMDMQKAIFQQTRSTEPIREFYVVEPTVVAPGQLLPRYTAGINNLERYLIGDGRILIPGP